MLPAAFLQPSQFRVEIGGRKVGGGMCFMEDELQQAWHKAFAQCCLPPTGPYRSSPQSVTRHHHALQNKV